MRVVVSKNGLNRQEGTVAAMERSMRLALIVSVSVLGVACVYFGVLYLIAH
jgi:hypothetical protein